MTVKAWAMVAWLVVVVGEGETQKNESEVLIWTNEVLTHVARITTYDRFNEFDANGGPISKELIPKLTVVKKNLSSKLGVALPDIDARQFIATIIFLKGVGGILFVFGSTFGSFLLLLHLAITTPLLYDFYNYRPGKPKYNQLLNDFLLNTALFGALLFFIGMKNSIPRSQLRKKTPKAKTV
ncbi:hypothetical protein JHK82_055892 [Glycine max]|nr:hypothetical protein JHK86_055715 [Glycine max]KAG5074524.1 hypothetical protein JHK84_055755 [Glycine max]KAG5077197.1 hypothetical protein JHK82_055892 [Glycine max]